MDFEFSPEETAFRTELREFLADILPDWWRGHNRYGTWNFDQDSFDLTLRVAQEMAGKGWLTMHWPKEYGGLEASIWEQVIMREEMAANSEPRGQQYMSTNWVGPAIMLFGTEQQKATHLTRISDGKALWCQGFSEPDAGSDLASLQTRAVRDGDDFVINGEKIWTSHTPHAEWCFLTARTDPEAPKHRGISVFLLPTSTPGISIRQIESMRGIGSFSSMVFDDVRVPASALLGDENAGWQVITQALNYERVGSTGFVGSRQHLQELIQYCSRTSRDGAPLSDDDWIRQNIARLWVELDVAQLFFYWSASLAAEGEDFSLAASLAKLASVTAQDVAALSYDVAGAEAAVLEEDSPARHWIDTIPHTIAAGTTEVQKYVIATRGLGLPR